jgi:glutamate--cysteine ligase
MIESHAVIQKEEDLDGYFEAGAKPRDRWGVGLEYERFGVLRNGVAPVPYDGPVSVEALIGRLVRERGWTPTEEAGRLLGARLGDTRLTLEPGCQLELSGGVHRDLDEMRAELAAFLEAVESFSRPAGIAWLGIGMQPFAALDAIPWIPKRRYAIMRDYLPTRGTRGLIMMKQTACIQANLDYGSENDAMDKLRTALGVSPLVTAMFANSPLTEGRPNGHLSRRAWAWRDTDPDRCGLLPFAYGDDARFSDYLRWALDVPMFFVARGDGYHPAGGSTFRQFIRRGFEGARPTLADFELHLTTLFPEVRLKRYLEMRGADSCDPASAMALAALWKGLLYDDAARREAWALVRDWSFEERGALLDAVCVLGPDAPLPRGGSSMGATRRAGELSGEILRLARTGLAAQGAASEVIWIERFERRLRRDGGCPGRRILSTWEGPMGRDPGRLVEDLSRDTLVESD